MNARKSESSIDELPGSGAHLSFAGLLANQWKLLIFVFVFTLIQTVCTLGVPLLFAEAIDDITTDDESGVWLYAALSVLLATVMAVSMGVASFISNRTGLQMEAAVRIELLDRMTDPGSLVHRKFSVGDLVNRTVFNTIPINPGLINNLPRLLQELLFFAAGGAVLFASSWQLALICLWPLPIIFWLTSNYNSRLGPLMKAVQRSTGRLTECVNSGLSHPETNATYLLTETVTSDINTSINEVYTNEVRLSKVNAIFYPLLTVLPLFGQMALFLAGGYMVINGTISLGTFTLFATYLALIVTAVQNFGIRLAAGGKVSTTVDLANEVLRVPSIAGGKEWPAVGGPTIEASEMSYSLAGYQLLSDSNFRIPAQGATAVIGPSGSGHSMLIAVLSGSLGFENSSGLLTLDGTSYQELDPVAVALHVKTLTEVPQIVAGTVHGNVAYGAPDADVETVRGALAAVGALDMVDQLPDGIDTLIGPDGVPISEPDQSRICLARAVITQPGLLCLDGTLDDPAFDKRELLASLKRACPETTIVIATTQREIAADSDHILVLGEGGVIAEGTVDEVVLADDFARGFVAQVSR